MSKSLRIITSCIFCFLFIACSAQKREAGSKTYITDKIVLEGFPSRDTISIIFYKKGTWFIAYNLLSRPTEQIPAEPCLDCGKTFTKAFMRSLMDLQAERIGIGCRIVKDTLIDGQQASQITDFYSISDLLKETITIIRKGTPVSISYLEPRTALAYCKNNKDRLTFIRYSNLLRAIR